MCDHSCVFIGWTISCDQLRRDYTCSVLSLLSCDCSGCCYEVLPPPLPPTPPPMLPSPRPPSPPAPPSPPPAPAGISALDRTVLERSRWYASRRQHELPLPPKCLCEDCVTSRDRNRTAPPGSIHHPHQGPEQQVPRELTVPQSAAHQSAADVTRLVIEAVRLQTEAFAQVMREQNEAAAERARVEAAERREASEAGT